MGTEGKHREKDMNQRDKRLAVSMESSKRRRKLEIKKETREERGTETEGFSEKWQIELQTTARTIPKSLRACCHGNVIIVDSALIRGSLLS